MNTALHASLAGMGQTTGTQIHAIVNTVLANAATYDPEPISKAILGVATLISNFFFQPDYNKLATSAIVTKAESLLQQNLNAWTGLSASEKTPAVQAAALQNFDTVWAQVQSACGSGQYGSAGQNCISDRDRGGCHYLVGPGGGCTPDAPTCWVQDASGAWTLSWSGGVGSGTACWNWFVGYRDPIANDPQVAANVAAAAAAASASAAATTGTASTAGSTGDPVGAAAGAVSAMLGGSIPPNMLIIGAGVLVAFFLVDAMS